MRENNYVILVQIFAILLSTSIYKSDDMLNLLCMYFPTECKYVKVRNSCYLQKFGNVSAEQYYHLFALASIFYKSKVIFLDIWCVDKSKYTLDGFDCMNDIVQVDFGERKDFIKNIYFGIENFLKSSQNCFISTS